ncbi:MAG: hypothetical protein H5T61_03655 [Thermoflexales bacterium]|nr:hypothetical protein [Thermoflexales bacterium]
MTRWTLWAIPISMLYTESDRDFPAVRMVVRGLGLLKVGDLAGAERLMREALEVARRGHHSVGEGMAALCLSNIYWGTGGEASRALLARELAQRARDIFGQQAGPDQRHNEAVATFNLGLVHHLTGEHYEALNEYYKAQKLLDRARRYWIRHNRGEQASQCDRLDAWIQHLVERLITSDPQQRDLTLFLPIGVADGVTATLWGEYGRDTSVILDGKTLRTVPLKGPLVLTADCCIFPIPPQVWQQIQLPSGQTGDYALTHPGNPLKDDSFYISLNNQGITQFIRQPDKTIVAEIQGVRVIGGKGEQNHRNYRPIALLI